MKELSVGMYVRTKCGLIAKIQSINEYNVALMNTCCERREDKYFTFPNEEKIYEIIKASHNIIELIEVGDYVNGSKVVNKYQNDSVVIEKEKMIYEEDGTIWSDCIEVNVKEIETIVTKEQFKSMEYIVKE